MYCPKCGIQNDETKFCRGCGEDLKRISQAMSSRLPAFLASKIDAHIERRNRQLRKDSIGLASIGGLFIFLGLYHAFGRGASWANEWFNVAFGCFMIFLGTWDYMVYQRSLSTEVKIARMRATDRPNALPPPDDAQSAAPATSVTESTTEILDAIPRRREKY